MSTRAKVIVCAGTVVLGPIVQLLFITPTK